jgi:aryl-alcohol dehydrogenase-like predicted oxidoreductase
MNYRFLSDTGLKVSQLCFGTMSFGGDADEKTSERMFNRCCDIGINFFDCANVYNNGLAEEILGKLIKKNRSDHIVTTKVYFPTGEDINAKGASRRHIFSSVEASLKRLQTDYIDLYFIHQFDEETNPEETMRALDDLVHQGKVLYLGASNFAAWQVMKCIGISEKCNLNRFKCIQPMYNLVKRQAEVELLPMALAENLAVTSYSPLGGGLLTGKYSSSTRPKHGRLVENKMYQTRYQSQIYYEIAEDFARFAKTNGFDPAALAVAWVASHPAVTAPIIGARTVGQLNNTLHCLEIDIPENFRSRISQLSPSPPPATDRTEQSTAFNFEYAIKENVK